MSGIENRQIVVGVWPLLTAVAVLLGGLLGGIWVVATFTMGGFRDDVADIRSTLNGMQAERADIVENAHGTELDLRGELSELTGQLRETNASLAALAESVGGLNTSIVRIDARMMQSAMRQENFERWVVTRLGTAGSQPTLIPTWTEAQNEVVQAVESGEEPLMIWYKSTQTN